MGRPRRHGADTAEALLDAAERVVEAEGVDALTVRRVAEEVGTTTRAVYSVFGSKEALLTALGVHAFEVLRAGVAAVPVTDDPAADVVRAGAEVFRAFAVEHPSLFRIGIQRLLVPRELVGGFGSTASAALDELRARMARLDERGLLGGRSVDRAAMEFHALCEGLAAMELRSLLPRDDEERVWQDALSSLVRGFAS
jgi:AcrR family transcriptional regulator